MHELFRQPHSRQGAAQANRPRDLLAQRYLEVGIPAVASALAVRSQRAENRQSGAQKDTGPDGSRKS